MRVVVCLLALAVFAGCSETPPGGEEHLQDDTGEGNATAPPANVNATAPVAVLTVDVLNGSAPLQVNFTIEAVNATGWLLDFGDGNQTRGGGLPDPGTGNGTGNQTGNQTGASDITAQVNHTYEEGAFVANLTVFGPGGNASASVEIQVAAPAVALQPFEQSVDVDLPCPGCGDAGTLSCTWRTHGNGNAQDCAWIDFPDELAGQPFTLTGNGLDADLLFWESCNSGVGPKFHGSGDEAGTVPEGMGCVLVWEQLDALITLTFTITPV